MARVSLKNVANEAGVSVSLVSRVLRKEMGNVTASEDVKNKIIEAAEKLGYVPDKRASSLRTGKNGMIAVVLPIAFNFSTSVYPELLRGIMEESKKTKYDYVYRYFMSQEDEIETLQYIASMHIDGLIYSPSAYNLYTKEKQALFNKISENGVKMVFCCEKYPVENSASICVDDIAGARMALQVLLDNGAKEVTYFYALMERRLEAIKKMCEEKDILLHVVECNNILMNSARSSAEKYLKKNRPRYVIASSDVHALEIRGVCLRQNIDPIIVGFDGLQFVGLLERPFPSIYQPVYEIGCFSVRKLMKMLNGEATEREVLLQPKVVYR